MKNYSIWLDNINQTKSEKLKQNLNVDVLIIGGGITGLSAAYHLKDSNLNVCLVERNQIGHGVTSRSTAKLTYLQETIYEQIGDLEKAKLYLKSQKEAMNLVDKIIKENNIECDYEEVPSYLFAKEEKNISKVKKQKEILEKFGIDVKEEKLSDNEPNEYSIKVDDTAVFHPLKYLLNIKKIIENKISIYEDTKVTDIKKDDGHYICKANNYNIKAKKIIFAVHYPYFLFPFMMPIKCHLEKSYIAAFKNKNHHFSAINTDKDTISIRYHESEESYKLYLTGSHNLAFKNDEKDNFKKLKQQINCEPDYIWSNKDIITNDFLPYIGRLKDNLFIATGYNTWGMTNASIAGKIISDIILEKTNKYTKLFDPKRSFNIPALTNFSVDIFSNVKSFVGTKINKDKSWYSNNVKFEKRNGDDVAIYIDENKKEHIVYQKCPHLKCTIIFNEEEKTWDCPCHGSRFDMDGKCIEGPSNHNITYKK